VWVVALLAFFLVVGIIGFLKFWQIRSAMAANANFAPPPETVTSAIAREDTWQHRIEAPGSLRPVQGVILSTESAGKVAEIVFQSGEKVSKGQTLVRLDVSVEEAELKAATARAEFAVLNHERIRELRQTGALSGKEIDDIESQLKQTQAQVEQLRAAIDRKTIKAPFSGHVGIRQVQEGQYITAGTPIVSLQTLHPIYVNFTVPQQDVARIQTGQKVQLTVDAFPNTTFEGEVTAIDPQLDESMRTLGVQATIPNPAQKLRPGMFGKVSLVLSEGEKYVTLPATSIARAPYGDSVYVIEKMKDPKGKEYLGVKQQFVKVGSYRGEQVAILSGVKPGQEVVTSGLFKLRPGAAVVVNNEVKPGEKPVAQPPES
jgi:membrane fusion protein, multidrug efflux system